MSLSRELTGRLEAQAWANREKVRELFRPVACLSHTKPYANLGCGTGFSDIEKQVQKLGSVHPIAF